MSSNVVSQFLIPEGQGAHMEHVSSSLDLPLSRMNGTLAGHVPNNTDMLKEQRSLVEPMSRNPLLMTSNNGMGHKDSSGGSGSAHSSQWMSNQPGHLDGFVPGNVAGEKTAFPVKRKAEGGPQLNNSIQPQPFLSNKRPAHNGADVSSFGFLQPLGRKNAPAQSKLGSPGLQAQPNKNIVRNDLVPGKAGLQRGQNAKRQTAQMASASKVRPESSMSVRSKMRESLAAALALACQKQEHVTEKDQGDATANHRMPLDAQESGGQVPVSSSEETGPPKESSVDCRANDCQVFSTGLPPSGSSGNGGQTFQEFQYTSILPDEEVPFGNNFFAKDDLLQGNGLSWEFDFDMQMREAKDPQMVGKLKPVNEETQGHKDLRETAILAPENLAFKIEDELFKLFGGANKKYKEKGRSLLFNLKDRNNPELRERVMSGEILPEKLCSMSAEELASKELSQWRMAKAEEFAQMVVLPDTQVDLRRLVRKTHKGEYQVEVEHDDGISAEVSGGTSLITQPQPKKESEPHLPSKTNGKENVEHRGSKDQDFSDSLIIPTAGTDLMQGMMVEELKDADFLPSIVSLDEFMESLDSEPPFENLAAEGGQKYPPAHKESPKPANNSQASNQSSVSSIDYASKNADVIKKHEVDTTVKSSGSPAKQKILPNVASRVEYMWEGILQLNISSSVTVGSLFQSGEKTSTKEWPSSLEIKGRVRLDAFEKFLQQLPMSRTRAVMMLQFVLSEKSSENDLSTLSEAVDSYIVDERIGFAEPAPGVELYLCPSTPRMIDILRKHLRKELPKTNSSSENGLIGVVVWRTVHITNTNSPNSSSHHKHSSKKQPFAATKRVQDSPNVNANSSSPMFNKVSHSNPEHEEDDDVPPGFGHVAAARAARLTRDDDDLPEFNFSSDLDPSLRNLHPGMKMTERPVDQVRELIQKYGQSGNSATSTHFVGNRGLAGIEPWNNDEDDDIPEWHPDLPNHLHHQPVVHRLGPPSHLPSSDQHMAHFVNRPALGGLSQPPPGSRWVHPPGRLHGARWRQQH